MTDRVWEEDMPAEPVQVERVMNAAKAVEFERQERLKREQQAGPPACPGYQRPMIELKWFRDLKLQRDDVTLVSGVLDKGTFGILVGKPGTSKTFFAIDLALHIAAGDDWFGRRVEKGGVVYVAAEAGERIINRIIAYKLHHYGEDAEVDLPFAVVTTSVDLYGETGNTFELIENIKRAFPEGSGVSVALVIIDTLSRAMPGGDENAPDDMTAFVGNCDQIIRVTGATVLVVHHHGKDENRGARGHSSLFGAVDTELTAQRNEGAKVYTVNPTKQRDMAAGDPIAYRLHVVELGPDTSGNPMTSCVIEPADAALLKAAAKGPKLGQDAKIGLDLLRKAIDEAGQPPVTVDRFPPGALTVPVETWRRYFYTGTAKEDDADPKRRGEAQRKQFQRARRDLQAAKVIDIWADEVCLLGSG